MFDKFKRRPIPQRFREFREPEPVRPPQKKPQKETDNCEIEIKNTKQGKKISFKGKCGKEELRIFANNNGINLEEE